MTSDRHRDSSDAQYYDGWQGTLRLFGEVCAELPSLLREDINTVISKLKEDGTVEGEACGLGSCTRDGVSMYEWRERYREDTPICRRHWLMLLSMRAFAAAVVYGAISVLIGLLFWLVIVV